MRGRTKRATIQQGMRMQPREGGRESDGPYSGKPILSTAPPGDWRAVSMGAFSSHSRRLIRSSMRSSMGRELLQKGREAPGESSAQALVLTVLLIVPGGGGAT